MCFIWIFKRHVSSIIGVVSLIYSWFRQFFVSLTSNSRLLAKCISFTYGEVASWFDIFDLIFGVILLTAIDINTIFLLFATLLLTA